MHESSRVQDTNSRAGVGQIAGLPPGKIQAPDELQIERVRGVKHGETHNVGLLIHYVIQSQQGEVLRRQGRKRRGRGVCRGRAEIQVSDNVDSVSSPEHKRKLLRKEECIYKNKTGCWE